MIPSLSPVRHIVQRSLMVVPVLQTMVDLPGDCYERRPAAAAISWASFAARPGLVCGLSDLVPSSSASRWCGICCEVPSRIVLLSFCARSALVLTHFLCSFGARSGILSAFVLPSFCARFALVQIHFLCLFCSRSETLSTFVLHSFYARPAIVL